MKKKLLSVILAAAMVLSFAGCEKKAPVSESVSSTEVSASVSESVEEPVVEEVDPDIVPEFQLLALEGKFGNKNLRLTCKSHGNHNSLSHTT